MSLLGVSYEVEAEVVETETQGAITAMLDGEAIGDLHFVDYAGVTQITRIQVSPEHQREGVATGMLAALREYFPASVPAQYLMNLDARALADAVYDRFKRPTA